MLSTAGASFKVNCLSALTCFLHLEDRDENVECEKGKVISLLAFVLIGTFEMINGDKLAQRLCE